MENVWLVSAVWLALAFLAIDQQQYTVLVTAVIGSALLPTVIAQRWFKPTFRAMSSTTRIQAKQP
jgi:hypothetical protein